LNDLIITKLDNASRLLSEAKTLQETKSIVDIAAAAEVYARRQQLGEEAIGHAHEIKIYALCKLGEMLKGTPRNEGALKQGPVVPQGNHGNIPTLKDLRISKKISSLAQKLSGLRDGKVDSIARREQSLTQVLRQERAEQSMVATSETIANGSRGRILPLEALWQSPKQILSSYDFMSALRSHMDGFQPRLVGSLPMEVLAVPGVVEVFNAMEDALKDLKTAAKAANRKLAQLAEQAPQTLIPWGAQTPEHQKQLLIINARQKVGEGYCQELGCWGPITSKEIGFCIRHGQEGAKKEARDNGR